MDKFWVKYTMDNCEILTNFAPSKKIRMRMIQIKKVENRQMVEDFIRVPRSIYKDYPQYVPDMDSDIRQLIASCGANGIAAKLQPFVAYRDEKAVGRVVGIINERANQRWQVSNVRFSLIEFVDDEEVSRALLEAVAAWGRENGMQTIQGPMGISDFDKEGMLVDDFQLMGSMTAIYNPDYYPRHMEKLGFQKEVDWLQIRIQIPQEVPAKYRRVAQYCREQMGLRVVKLTDKAIRKDGYGQRVFELLNECYKNIFGFSKLSDGQIDAFLDKYLPLVDNRLMPIILNDRDEVVGAAITMGSLARALQKSGGRLWPFGWYYLVRSLKWKHEESAEMLLVAVRPDYQGMGVNAMFFDDLIPVYNDYGFKWAETGPQLETNVRELTQWKPLHPEYVKRRRCYTKKV